MTTIAAGAFESSRERVQSLDLARPRRRRARRRSAQVRSTPWPSGHTARQNQVVAAFTVAAVVQIGFGVLALMNPRRWSHSRRARQRRVSSPAG